MHRPSDLLESNLNIGDMEKFRTGLNKIQSFLDFIYDVCPKHLCYAKKVPWKQKVEEILEGVTKAESNKSERERPVALACSKRKKSISFWILKMQ